MKIIILFFLFQFSLTSYSQNLNSKNWKSFEYDNARHFTVTKTEKFNIDSFRFDIEWDKKLNYSDNIGYYGGIKLLKIYKDKHLIYSIKNIEDVIALGKIYFDFYDYNMDGFMDFSFPISQGKSQWRKYFLYDNSSNTFKSFKEWDYLRIGYMNKVTMQILTLPDENEQTLYKVIGFNLKKIKTIKF
jgi:hypothetical protein